MLLTPREGVGCWITFRETHLHSWVVTCTLFWWFQYCTWGPALSSWYDLSHWNSGRCSLDCLSICVNEPSRFAHVHLVVCYSRVPGNLDLEGLERNGVEVGVGGELVEEASQAEAPRLPSSYFVSVPQNQHKLQDLTLSPTGWPATASHTTTLLHMLFLYWECLLLYICPLTHFFKKSSAINLFP